MQISNIPSETHITAELCRRSLFEFLLEFWDECNTTAYTHNWHIEYLCDEVQLVIDKYLLNKSPHIEPDKWYKGILDNISLNLIINVPPGTTKSTIISRFAPAWLWANDDSKSIISSTVDDKNATEFATTSRDIIQSDKFQMLFPTIRIRKDVSAKTFYQSENNGRRYSLTTRGKSKTGKHADLLIDDDPMDYITAQSPQEVKQCIEGFKALQTRKKDKSNTPYILVMQRLSHIDTTAHGLKSLSNVRHICLPAEDIYDNIQPVELRKFYVNGLLDPVRLSKKVLVDQQKGLNDDSLPITELAYNIQFNQVSQTSQGLLYPNLQKVSRLPESRENAVRYSFTDVADTGSDYFATWFVEVNEGKIYVFDAIYTDAESGQTSEKLKNKIIMHGTIMNKLEVNNQGSVFVTLMTQLGVNVSGYLSTSNKESRINAWSYLISFVYFVEPGSMPYHDYEYTQALRHVEMYPKQGKSADGRDDAEDALTEMARYFWTNMRFLFNV